MGSSQAIVFLLVCGIVLAKGSLVRPQTSPVHGTGRSTVGRTTRDLIRCASSIRGLGLCDEYLFPKTSHAESFLRPTSQQYTYEEPPYPYTKLYQYYQEAPSFENVFPQQYGSVYPEVGSVYPEVGSVYPEVGSVYPEVETYPQYQQDSSSGYNTLQSSLWSNQASVRTDQLIVVIPESTFIKAKNKQLNDAKFNEKLNAQVEPGIVNSKHSSTILQSKEKSVEESTVELSKTPEEPKAAGVNGLYWISSTDSGSVNFEPVDQIDLAINIAQPPLSLIQADQVVIVVRKESAEIDQKETEVDENQSKPEKLITENIPKTDDSKSTLQNLQKKTPAQEKPFLEPASFSPDQSTVEQSVLETPVLMADKRKSEVKSPVVAEPAPEKPASHLEKPVANPTVAQKSVPAVQTPVLKTSVSKQRALVAEGFVSTPAPPALGTTEPLNVVTNPTLVTEAVLQAISLQEKPVTSPTAVKKPPLQTTSLEEKPPVTSSPAVKRPASETPALSSTEPVKTVTSTPAAKEPALQTTSLEERPPVTTSPTVKRPASDTTTEPVKTVTSTPAAKEPALQTSLEERPPVTSSSIVKRPASETPALATTEPVKTVTSTPDIKKPLPSNASSVAPELQKPETNLPVLDDSKPTTLPPILPTPIS